MPEKSRHIDCGAGFLQERIARALGCSQAMVSKCLASLLSGKYRRFHGNGGAHIAAIPAIHFGE